MKTSIRRITTSDRNSMMDSFRNDLILMVKDKILPLMGDLLYDPDNSEKKEAIREIINAGSALIESDLTPEEIETVKEEYLFEIIGLGVVQKLLDDREISEVMVNGIGPIFVEKHGQMYMSDVSVRSGSVLSAIVQKIRTISGRSVDEATPMLDAHLPDHSRINIVVPPICPSGPSITIRRPPVKMFSEEEFINFGSITKQQANFFKNAERGRLSILVSGGTGSGKTTLLNLLSSYIPQNERIITIQDSDELMFEHKNIVNLLTRSQNSEGRGEVTIRMLVKNALRMHPDRIIVGEVRGGEALDMLQAMNTGHEGSMTTLHANGVEEAVSRLETLVLMSGLDLPSKAIKQQISYALHLIVQISKQPNGRRFVSDVRELVGIDGDRILTNQIFNANAEQVGDLTERTKKHALTYGVADIWGYNQE